MTSLAYDTQSHRGTEKFFKGFSVPRSLCVLLWVIVASTVVEPAGNDVRLIEAIRSRTAEAVQSLIKQKIDVNDRQSDRSTALLWSVHLSDTNTVNLLLRAGAKTDVADDTGVTPLYLACLNRQGALVVRLLQSRANPNAAPVGAE